MKKLVSVILFVSILSVLLTACQSSTATFNGSGNKQTDIQLRIVTMDGEKLYDGKVKVIDDNPTVYMALEAAAKAKNLTLGIMDENDPSKMFLDSINDLKSENPKFWMYYINKKMSESGIGTQALNSSDVVEFIYGDYNKGYVEIK